MKKHPVRGQSKKSVGFLTAILAGALVSVLLGMILLALSCIPVLLLSDPLRFAPVFALASLFISTAVGARTAAKLHGKSGLACGVLSALVLILLLVMIACVLSLKIRMTLFTICAPALLLTSAVTGISGVSEKAPKVHKHKHGKFR